MQLASAVERNSQTLSTYGRYCGEMHQGIGDNRNMIITDRAAASTTRVEVSRLQRDVTDLNECMESNNSSIDERFTILETDSTNKSNTLAEFTKTLTDAYRTVFDE